MPANCTTCGCTSAFFKTNLRSLLADRRDLAIKRLDQDEGGEADELGLYHARYMVSKILWYVSGLSIPLA